MASKDQETKAQETYEFEPLQFTEALYNAIATDIVQVLDTAIKSSKKINDFLYQPYEDLRLTTAFKNFEAELPEPEYKVGSKIGREIDLEKTNKEPIRHQTKVHLARQLKVFSQDFTTNIETIRPGFKFLILNVIKFFNKNYSPKGSRFFQSINTYTKLKGAGDVVSQIADNCLEFVGKTRPFPKFVPPPKPADIFSVEKPDAKPEKPPVTKTRKRANSFLNYLSEKKGNLDTKKVKKNKPKIPETVVEARNPWTRRRRDGKAFTEETTKASGPSR